MNKPTCGTCPYWVQEEWRHFGNNGECRFNPRQSWTSSQPRERDAYELKVVGGFDFAPAEKNRMVWTTSRLPRVDRVTEKTARRFLISHPGRRTVAGMNGFKKFDFRLEEFTRPALRAWLLVAFLVITCNSTGFLGGCMFGHARSESNFRELERTLTKAQLQKAFLDGRLDAIISMADAANERNMPKKSPTINSPPKSSESERRDESSAPPR